MAGAVRTGLDDRTGDHGMTTTGGHEPEPLDLRGVQRGPSQGGLGMAWGPGVDTAREEPYLAPGETVVLPAEGTRIEFVAAEAIDPDLLHRQRAWSLETFGPGARTEGILQHLEKEHREIREKPDDLYEWVDLMILAVDGAWRAGHEPEAILAAYREKMDVNFAREWPDWRLSDQDSAIEHVRSEPIGPAIGDNGSRVEP